MPPLDPMSADARLIALKLLGIFDGELQGPASDKPLWMVSSLDDNGVELKLEGWLNLNQFAVQLAQLFWEELPCRSTRCPKTPS